MLLFGFVFTLGSVPASQAAALKAPASRKTERTYRSPAKYEKAIRAFERKDKDSPPPAGAVVCIGSSSMRMWHDRIREDLSPLTLIPRGFGGSTMHDLLHYTDRIVLPYKPRAIVVYEGDNDVAKGVSPAEIQQTFHTLPN